jgi:hypothetical protein
MKLKTFVDILRGGNLALGSKLSNLLTEDCTILEYTNDSVLFSKGSKLVLAKFKHPLTESRMTSQHVIDNEVIELSKIDLKDSMKETLNQVVAHVISENLVDAQESLNEFCQAFYQVAVIKNRYPDVFIESLKTQSRGASIRKEAKTLIPTFKAELFGAAVVTESSEDETVTKLLAIVESKLGLVLALGKTKVQDIVVDALLGNSVLAEAITSNLYSIAESLDSDSPVGELRDKKFDLESGKFGDEDASDVEDEDTEIPSVPTEKESFGDEDKGEYEPFNPAMFSEEDIKQLHKTTLKSILLAMQEFIHDKAVDTENSEIDPELADQVDADLEALDSGEELGDDRLSEIEARWNPMISYFLDSSYHTPAEELEELDDESLDEQLPQEDESVPTDSIEPEVAPDAALQAGAGAPPMAAPAPPPAMA